MKLQVFGGTVELDEAYLVDSPDVVRAQVAAYERGDRRTFDVEVTFPDGLVGEVMRAMRSIPYGETRTYGALAADIGTSPVAVGGACGRNPVPVVVPCHRVVAADGLGGFSAEGGTALKRRLLAHERGESLASFG